MPYITIISNNGSERKCLLEKDETSIGRHADNDIRIADDSVSSFHAQVRLEDSQHVITDLGSTNGLRVNGDRTTKAILNDGDLLRFGNVRARFEIKAGILKEAAAGEESQPSPEESPVTPPTPEESLETPSTTHPTEPVYTKSAAKEKPDAPKPPATPDESPDESPPKPPSGSTFPANTAFEDPFDEPAPLQPNFGPKTSNSEIPYKWLVNLGILAFVLTIITIVWLSLQ